MPLTLASNLNALTARRGLRDAGNELSGAVNRLSSGLRISKASDNAAELALSTAVTQSSRLTTQSLRSVADSSSFFQTSSEASSSLRQILTRIKEIANQSSNSIVSDENRSAMQEEVDALQSEYNRIIATTQLNSKYAFGTTSITVQAGAKGDAAVEMTIPEVADLSGALYGIPTTRISVSSSGTQAVGGLSAGGPPVTSSDGRYIAYSAYASNLVAGDTNGTNDVFYRDQLTATTTRISVSSAGVQANAGSITDGVSISDDGRYVVFQSTATNLIAGDTNGVNDVFLRDTVLGTTTRISVATGGIQGNAASTDPMISGDGRYVTFTSSASNLVAGDTNGGGDIFLHDTQTGTTTRVSVSTAGTQANSFSLNSTISDDGRFVAFQSLATNLVASDTNAVGDIFVRDTQLNTTTRVSVSSVGVEANQASADPIISGNGRYVVYESFASNLVAGDTNADTDSFMYDINTAQTIRLSVSSSGAEVFGTSIDPAISDDGRFAVFLSSATNLVSGDTNGSSDVFIRDNTNGQIVMASVTESGGLGNSPGASIRPAISDDGKYVIFISSSTNLVAGDTNGSADAFSIFNSFLTSSSTSTLTEMSGIDVSTQSNALTSLASLQSFVAEVEASGAAFAAALSRLGSISRFLTNERDNLMRANSRIVDADITLDTATFISATAKKEAATAAFSRSNDMGSIPLALLKKSIIS